MFLYAKLLWGERSGCVVKLHGRLAETWLVACEAAPLQGSVHKMEKSSAKYRSFISLLKNKLEMSFHFAFFSWRGGWHLFYICGFSQNQLCRGGLGQRNPGLSGPFSLDLVKAFGSWRRCWHSQWYCQVQIISTNIRWMSSFAVDWLINCIPACPPTFQW